MEGTGVVALKFSARALMLGAAISLTGCGEGSVIAEPEKPVCITPITVAAVGDFLLHGPLQRFAANQPDGMQAVMNPVKDLIRAADIALVNLEGPAAENLVGLSGVEIPTPATRHDGRAYSSYPMFNYHPSVIADLKAVGFDVLQTANNHSVDRGGPGVDKTLEAIKAQGLPATGTRMASATKEGFDWSARFTVKRDEQSYQFAVIACAYGTNGLPDPKDQVLGCYDDRAELLEQIGKLHADKDIAAVIVMPHWGNEYQPVPDTNQTTLAQDMADAGATAIIGSHPHVVQPDAVLTAKDGRAVPIVYSLGNFVSRQIGLPRLATVIYMVGFTPSEGGKLAATLTGWIPLRMQTGGVFSIDPLDRLPEGEAAPYAAHLLKSFDAKTRLPADPKALWNTAGKPVCAPKAEAKPS